MWTSCYGTCRGDVAQYGRQDQPRSIGGEQCCVSCLSAPRIHREEASCPRIFPNCLARTHPREVHMCIRPLCISLKIGTVHNRRVSIRRAMIYLWTFPTTCVGLLFLPFVRS